MLSKFLCLDKREKKMVNATETGAPVSKKNVMWIGWSWTLNVNERNLDWFVNHAWEKNPGVNAFDQVI